VVYCLQMFEPNWFLVLLCCWNRNFVEAQSSRHLTEFINRLLQFMPVLRKSTSHHKTALRQTLLERNGHLSAGRPSLNFAVTPPRHRPTPSLPIMTYLEFEVILLSYLIMAMMIQYMNIYKANFYVMDYHLILFITIILLRRVGWLMLKQTLASEVMYSLLYWTKVCVKTVLLLSMVAVSVWSLYYVIQNSAFEDVLFLCYPFAVYLWTFGFTLNPYSHSVLFKLGPHQSHQVTELITSNTSLFHQAVTLQNVSVNSITSPSCRGKGGNKAYEINGTILPTNSTTSNGDKPPRTTPKETQQCNGHGPPDHLDSPLTRKCAREQCCMSPDSVRYEAECLRTDFNLRMKQILFNSLISAYYVAFIPLKFTQNGWLYYDVWWSAQHIFFVWMSTFILLVNFLVPHHYIDGLHKCALHLGAWTEYNGNMETPHVWSPLTIWPEGALVRHSKGLFRAIGQHNTAVPGDSHHSRFYFIFRSPLRLLNLMMLLQTLTVLCQFYVLICSTYWYQCISVLSMSSINFYLTFRIFRERWAVQASYHEHARCTS